MNQKLLNKISNFKFSELNIDYILNTLKDRYRWPYRYFNYYTPSVEIIDKFYKPLDIYDEDGYVNSEKIISLYERGYTLILSKCQFLSKEIRQFYKLFETNEEIQINLYMSKGLKYISFPPHSHTYDVLVKNVCGKSEWILGEKNIILKGNGIINIPKNVIHGVTKIYLPKLSITCNLL